MLSPKHIQPANLEHDAVKRQTLRYFNTGSISFDVILVLALISLLSTNAITSSSEAGKTLTVVPRLVCAKTGIPTSSEGCVSLDRRM